MVCIRLQTWVARLLIMHALYVFVLAHSRTIPRVNLLAHTGPYLPAGLSNLQDWGMPLDRAACRAARSNPLFRPHPNAHVNSRRHFKAATDRKVAGPLSE